MMMIMAMMKIMLTSREGVDWSGVTHTHTMRAGGKDGAADVEHLTSIQTAQRGT